MRKICVWLLWATMCMPAYGQNAVTQSGTITPGHIATWTQDRQIQDGGPVPSAASPFINPISYGADPNGLADSTAAIQAALTAIAASCKPIQLSPGTYLLSGGVSVVLTADNCRFALLGSGATLKWIAAGGMTITLAVPTSINTQCYKGSVKVKDVGFQTMVAGGGTGLTVNVTSSCTNASGAPVSSIEASFFGDSETTYWNTGLLLNKLSNVNLELDVRGRAALGQGLGPIGTGLSLIATSSEHGVGYNVRSSNFEGLTRGILMGDYTEGLTVTAGSNFTSISPGCGVELNGAATLQAMIANSQFGVSSGHICAISDFTDLNIVGNLFISFGGNKMIWLQRKAINATIIANNQFLGGDVTLVDGVYADQSSGTAVLSGNYFQAFGNFVNVLSATARVDLRSNDNIMDPTNKPVIVSNSAVSPFVVFPDIVDLKAFGATCDGVTSDQSAFTAASIMPGVKDLGIYGPCVLTTSLTLPMPLRIFRSGSINIAAAQTLTTAGVNADTATPFTGAGVASEGAQLTLGTGVNARQTFHGPDLRLPAIGVTPGGKQPVCMDTVTKQVYFGNAGAC